MSVPIQRITIGDRICAYRKERCLTQKEFGKLFGVSAQAVYKWEREISHS